MKKWAVFLFQYKVSFSIGALALALLAFGLAPSFLSDSLKVNTLDQGSYQAAPYGSLEPVKDFIETEFRDSDRNEPVLSRESLRELLAKYNEDLSRGEYSLGSDPIDNFIAQLPESYRRHFTLIHKSFSIQEATPQNPRVILFGPDAKVMMTFNGHTKMRGGDSIEIIEWNEQKTSWSFSEIKQTLNGNLVHNENPQSCVLCHAGSPKPANNLHADLYKDELKPIFPQYPFWPGFYGSVNDIVGLELPGSKDTVMRNQKDTFDQVRSLTFADTEELHRLRRLLDTNREYEQVIKNELDVHRKHFPQFMAVRPSKSRYRHLLTVNDYYSRAGRSIPESLKAAPYRRTFDKEYGHYLLRPNFYLSSLLTFYQAQVIAKKIYEFPGFDKISANFLSQKYNCTPSQVGALSTQNLSESFDLLYPNQTSQQKRHLQYLLAYQYNQIAQQKTKKTALPLAHWNLESSEEISSYHYGNVFADLNEIVLWNLARKVFPQLTSSHGKSAAEGRHAEMPIGNYFQSRLDSAQGFVSRMDASAFQFANTLQSYNGSAQKFKAQPVSSYCQAVFAPAAKRELQKLASLPEAEYKLNLQYALDPRITELEKITGQPGITLDATRQSCEGCHVATISPKINVDWFSVNYAEDLKRQYTGPHVKVNGLTTVKDYIQHTIAKDRLPVPYGNAMPFARMKMSDFTLSCEQKIVQANFMANISLRAASFGCDRAVDPNSEGCRCQKLFLLKDRLYRQFWLPE